MENRQRYLLWTWLYK